MPAFAFAWGLGTIDLLAGIRWGDLPTGEQGRDIFHGIGSCKHGSHQTVGGAAAILACRFHLSIRIGIQSGRKYVPQATPLRDAGGTSRRLLRVRA